MHIMQQRNVALDLLIVVILGLKSVTADKQ